MSGVHHKAAGPKLYCILATKAPIALVFRRGPSDWFHLLKWRLDNGTLEPGVWVRKKLYPRRCDLSEDGELMLYYLAGGFSGKYQVCGGISRVPWLSPLTSWEEGDTWGRGSWFVTDSPAHGQGAVTDINLGARRVLVQANDNVAFVNELRRGWRPSADCPPRDFDDMWDEKRSVILQKESPSADCIMRLVGGRYDSANGVDGLAPAFELRFPSGRHQLLDDARWADWDQHGRLLVATEDGFLRAELVENGARRIVEQHDLRGLTPNPQPPPEWACALTSPSPS